MKRRYVVVLDAYLWAENDKDARIKANEYAKRLPTCSDASVLEIYENNFGQLTSRKVG